VLVTLWALGVYRLAWRLASGLASMRAPCAGSPAIAEDREVKAVAVRGVFYDHLGLQYRCGKIGIGHGLLTTRPLAGVQKPQGLSERRAHDL
jgi:hypothetical protein